MINVLTRVFAQYMATPFEDFTSKYILARGIFQLLGEDTYKKEDFETIEKIEKWTDDKTKISLYKLDRVVNPSKGDFQTTVKKFKFYRNVVEGKKDLELDENKIQDILCKAIREVHEIIMRVMKDYKIEQSMVQGDEEDKAEIDKLFKA